MDEPHIKAEPPWKALRVGAGVLASLLTVLILLIVCNQSLEGFDPFGASMGAALGAAAAILWWFALLAHRPNTLPKIGYAVIGGLIVGGIGQLAGVIGPMIFIAGANQGPLLGMLVTGPCGFALGSFLGAIAGFCFHRPRREG